MTFTDVHTGRQKVPKSDFQSHFSMSKNVQIFLKKINISPVEPVLEKKDFTGALSEFNKLPKSVTANYYAGVANMELKDHIAAIAKFDYVIKDYLNLFYDQAQWYKGLCLVKLERKEEAVALFSQITKTESYFKEKAKQIERDLKSE